MHLLPAGNVVVRAYDTGGSLLRRIFEELPPTRRSLGLDSGEIGQGGEAWAAAVDRGSLAGLRLRINDRVVGSEALIFVARGGLGEHFTAYVEPRGTGGGPSGAAVADTSDGENRGGGHGSAPGRSRMTRSTFE